MNYVALIFHNDNNTIEFVELKLPDPKELLDRVKNLIHPDNDTIRIYSVNQLDQLIKDCYTFNPTLSRDHGLELITNLNEGKYTPTELQAIMKGV